MPKGKKFILLLLQLALMAVFVVGIYYNTQKELEPVDVYVYAKKMSKNSEIEMADLRKVQIPANAVGKNFLNEATIKKIKEGNMVVTSDVESGQYVYNSQITSNSNVDPFEKIDLSKYRIVSIPSSYETTMGGEVKRGDKIDLAYIGQVSGQSSYGQDDESVYSTVFMQDVLVYSVTTGEGFQFVDHAQMKKSDLNSEDVEKNQSLTGEDIEGAIALVSVAVPMSKVEEILARQEKGVVKVVGRFKESENTNAPGFVLGSEKISGVYAGNKNAELTN